MSFTDLPTTITSLSIGNKYKKVVNYYHAPKELIELEDTIERVAGLLRLIYKI